MRRRDNTEERILAKAVGLFYKVGYVRASIRDIAKAAGVSNAAIYLYFKKKDDLLYKIIDGVGKELLGNLQAVAEVHDDSTECLEAMITEQIHFSMDSYKRMKIYLEEQYQLPPYLRKKAYKRHREIYDLYSEKISDLEAEGALIEADNILMTFNIFASINWLYRWFNPKGRLSIEECARDMIKILFLGILKKTKK